MAHDTALGGWPAARITANARANLKTLWGFTLFWNIVSAPVLVYIPPELHRNPVAAIGLVFPVAGAGLLIWTTIATLRWRRFGETWLDTTAGPATIGAAFTATLHARLPQPAAPADYRVLLRLSCLQRSVSRNSSERTEHERILWREETEIAASRMAFGPEGASIPVRFDIPADALETTAGGRGEGVFWVLTAEAALPGLNLKEDFDVPVRRGMGRVRRPGPTTLTMASVRGPGSSDPGRPAISLDDLARTGIVVEPAAEGTSFRFAPRRNLSFAAGVTVFTAIWTAALWLQWHLGFPWIFPIVTGLVDVLLVFIVADLWLGTTIVTIGAGTVRLRHTVLGVGSTKAIAAAEIARSICTSECRRRDASARPTTTSAQR